MTKRDLVSREHDQNDRRRVLLQVTAHAAELGTTFFGPVIDRAVNELARFTPEQRATIDEFLTAMHAVVAATREQQNP